MANLVVILASRMYLTLPDYCVLSLTSPYRYSKKVMT